MCSYSGYSSSSEEQKIALENKWMEGNLPAINSNLLDRAHILDEETFSNGDLFDFIWGAVVGVFLSALGLLCVRFT